MNLPESLGVTRGSPTPITISLIPILINRAVLFLKKAADFRNGIDQAWGMGHLSTIEFKPPSTVVPQLPDDPLETRPDVDNHNGVALGGLAQRAGS